MINKSKFPTIDLSIIESETENNTFYSSKVVYIEDALNREIYCRHDVELELQKEYLNYEQKYLDIFVLLIHEYWPCIRILENSSYLTISSREYFIDLITRALREQLTSCNNEIQLTFILDKLDCIIHISFDLKLILYYVKKSKHLDRLLKMLYRNGFAIE